MRTRILVLMLLVITVGSTVVYFGVSAQDAAIAQPASPLPPPSPTVETQPLDPAARRALEYAAEVRKLSPNQLAIRYREDVTFPTLQRSFVRFVINAPSDAASAETELLVDVASDDVETNVDAWIAAERTAYTEKYGRLNPGLYERLQQTDDQERLPVAIWVARTEQDKPVEKLLAAAAGDDPAALDALRTQGVPWAVVDEEQARAIHERYAELLNAEVAQRVAPLAAELRIQGHAVTEFTGMPALAAHLPKHAIFALSERQDVTQIILIEAEAAPASDVVIRAGMDCRLAGSARSCSKPTVPSSPSCVRMPPTALPVTTVSC